MNKRKTLFLLASFAVFFLLISVTYILFEWYSVSDGPPNEDLINPPCIFSIFMVPVFFAGLAAYIVVPVTFIGFFFPRGKARSVLLILCAIFIMAFLATKLSQTLTWKIHKAAFTRVSQRAEVIIQAIESYRTKEHKPPESLDDLVPEYIAKIPGTGIRSYPAFEYATPNSTDQYHKKILEKHNAVYELRVNCFWGWIGLDHFIYWPSETYPDRIYGGDTELINKWAYVHE